MVTTDGEMMIPAGEFKARCLALLDLVGRTRSSITITKRGTPVARLVPLAAGEPRARFGWLAGMVSGEEDVVNPVGEPWEAEADG